MNDLVPAAVGGAIALAGGAVGLLGKQLFDRRTASHEARRALYVELLTLLMGRREYMRAATWSREIVWSPKPNVADLPKVLDLPTEEIDRLNTLLSIDATDAVATKARVCFELLNRFGVSRVVDVPVEVADDGYYRFRNDLLVADQPQEAHDMTMKFALARIAFEYGDALADLAAQVKREVHRPL